MKTVITYFVLYEKEYQQAAGHPRCKAENIDKGESFISKKISEGDLEIVSDHKEAFSF